MTVHMAVTADEYELVCFEADSLYALAKILGVHKDVVYKAYKRESVINHKYRIISVDIEEDEDGTFEDC